MYYIGIDGGGTKTAFGLFDKAGNLINQVTYSTSHFLQVGYKGCADILYQGIYELLNKFCLSPKEVHIGIGIAGYGNDEHVRRQLEGAIQSQLHEFWYVLTSDMHIALIGALNAQDGIAIVAGTGTIAMAQIDNQNIRCGGWGYQLGDEGSAYWVGKQMLNVFCKQVDGRMERTDLYEMLMHYYQISNPYQIIQIIGKLENQRTEIAKLAILCDQLASNNESNCQNILKEAAKSLVELIDVLRQHFNGNITLAYYGGVFQSLLVKNTFIETLHPCIKVIEPIHGALTGAYLFAVKKEQ